MFNDYYTLGLRNANENNVSSYGLYDTDVYLTRLDKNWKPVGAPILAVEAQILDILDGNHYTLHNPVNDNGVIYYATVDSDDDATTCILDLNFMDEVAKKLGDGFYILPFTTRVIGFVAREEVSLKILARVVYMTNRASIGERVSDRLSDSVWTYDAIRRTIKTAWYGGDIRKDYWDEESCDTFDICDWDNYEKLEEEDFVEC